MNGSEAYQRPVRALGKADPRVKLLAILLTTTLALLFQSVWWMVGLTAITLVLALLLGADLMGFFKKFRAFLSLILLLVVVQLVFVREGNPLLVIGNFTLVTDLGLVRGVATGLRFFIILCAAGVMAAENYRRVVQGLVQLHVPYTFAFMLSIALRFLPLFGEEFSDSVTAIQLRGIELKEVKWRRRMSLYGHLLLPVVAGAVIKSQDLATAMEARGFRAKKQRTSYLHLTLTALDWTLLVALVLAAAAALWCYYAL